MKVPEDNLDALLQNLEFSTLLAARREQDITAQAALVEAIKLSSGNLSTSELRALDNPFAKRHGNPLLPPGIINKHSADGFADHWKLLHAGESTADSTFVGPLQNVTRPTITDPESPTLYNDSPVAPWLQFGTRKMFARPIDKLIMEKVGPTREATLRKEIDRLEK